MPFEPVSTLSSMMADSMTAFGRFAFTCALRSFPESTESRRLTFFEARWFRASTP